MASISLSRRVATAARWPLGVGLTSWRYLWRTTPLSRRELGGDLDEHRAPEFPEDFDREGLQRPRGGAGPMFHRRYRIRIADPKISAKDLMETIRKDPDVFAPSEFATFEKAGDGDSDTICRPGEEFVVRMPGPWDGPVRVVSVTDSCIRLATLEGHLEAGQIEFRAIEEDGLLVFTIESWARSSSRLTDLLYDRLRMAKEIQVHMWVSFLEHGTQRTGGRRRGCVEIRTRRVDEPPDA
ncbi:MAG TPA: DUF1990 family protein [Thermoleophilaceae bacterium]|nr:DUF1990 family protein [Thermoleophilaceae bacterium]